MRIVVARYASLAKSSSISRSHAMRMTNGSSNATHVSQKNT